MSLLEDLCTALYRDVIEGRTLTLVRLPFGWQTEGLTRDLWLVEPGTEIDCNEYGVTGISKEDDPEKAVEMAVLELL